MSIFVIHHLFRPQTRPNDEPRPHTYPKPPLPTSGAKHEIYDHIRIARRSSRAYLSAGEPGQWQLSQHSPGPKQTRVRLIFQHSGALSQYAKHTAPCSTSRSRNDCHSFHPSKLRPAKSHSRHKRTHASYRAANARTSGTKRPNH